MPHHRDAGRHAGTRRNHRDAHVNALPPLLPAKLAGVLLQGYSRERGIQTLHAVAPPLGLLSTLNYPPNPRLMLLCLVYILVSKQTGQPPRSIVARQGAAPEMT